MRESKSTSSPPVSSDASLTTSTKSTTVSSDGTFTVHDAIEAVGFGRFQIAMSFLAGFAWMADSMEVMLLSLLSPALACEWGISPSQQALSTTCVFAGWSIGSPFWGWFCDRFGRRKGLFISSLVCSIFGIATAFSTSFTMFVIVRGCVGLSLGGVAQVVTIYTEFLPTAKRAFCVVGLEFFWAIGAAVEAVVALAIMPSLGWRYLVVFSSLPLLLFALCCKWLPESARYHVSRGQNDKARTVLERVARANSRALPEGTLVAAKPEAAAPAAAAAAGDEKPNKPEEPGLLALLRAPFLRTTLLVWVLWAMNAFAYYGMSLYTTKLFQSTDTCHGGSEANAAANATLTGCVPLTRSDYVDIIATSFSEVPGLLLTFVLIERLGRKLTMSLQFVAFGVANYLIYFCMSRSLMVAILFCARAFISGSFQTAYVYTPEVYPTNMRALGIGTASAFGRAGAMVTPYVAQVVADYNLLYSTLIYGTCGLIGAAASFALPIETAGRQMADISAAH